MFDPATAEDFELNQNLKPFHNDDLLSDRESLLSESLFRGVLAFLGLDIIDYNQCLGYRKPLFPGGADSLENYELWDAEVFWEFQRQIYFQIKDLPPGTKINSIKFKPDYIALLPSLFRML